MLCHHRHLFPLLVGDAVAALALSPRSSIAARTWRRQGSRPQSTESRIGNYSICQPSTNNRKPGVSDYAAIPTAVIFRVVHLHLPAVEIPS